MYRFVYHARKTHDWIGRQLIAITNTFLVPQLSFDTLTYNAPGTVKLRTAKLTAPGGTDVIDVSELTLTLAQTPRPGRPLQIENIEIVGGKLHLIRDTTTTPIVTITQQQTGDSEDDDHVILDLADHEELRFALKGLSPFLKSQLAPREQRPQKPDDPYAETSRLSDVFVLRRVKLSDCAVEYDPSDGSPPTILDGINAEININPDATDNQADPNQQGWYTVSINSGRAPISTTSLTADINIDTLDFRIHALDMHLTIDAYTARSLPGSLQRLVNQHGLRATAHLHVTATGNLADESTLQADARLTLDDCSAILGEYRVPIERLVATTQLRGQNARTTIDAGIATGTVLANIAIDAQNKETPSLELDWAISDVNLAHFFSSMTSENAATETSQPEIAAGTPSTTDRSETSNDSTTTSAVPPDSPDPLGLVRRIDPDAPQNQPDQQQQQSETAETQEAQTQPSQTQTASSAPPRLVGIASSTGQARTTLSDPIENINGAGEIMLRNSQLVSVPIISHLASAMQLVLRTTNTHSLEASFDLTPQGVQITRSLVRTEVLAARGTGLVGYDGSLDLRVNGGPLEKVQSLLGGIGDVLGAVTDNIMTYRVRGTFAEPTVTVHPLGLGAGRRQPSRTRAMQNTASTSPQTQ